MLQHPRASNRGAAIPLESNRGAKQKAVARSGERVPCGDTA